MNEPDIVSDKISGKINYVYLAIGMVAIGVFQGLTMMIEDEDFADILTMIASVVGTLSVMIISFIVAKRYDWKTSAFGKAYFALGVGFGSYAVGEILYYTLLLVFNYDAYPSIADVFFMGFYVGALIHLILNIRFFSNKLEGKTILWMTLVTIIVVLLYVYFVLQGVDDPEFDYLDLYLGIAYIVPATVLLSLSIQATKILYVGAIGIAWVLITSALALSAISDVGYYYLEIFGEYYTVHPINMGWMLSQFIMCYALITHRKVM